VHHPLLELDQFDVEFRQFLLLFLAPELAWPIRCSRFQVIVLIFVFVFAFIFVFLAVTPSVTSLSLEKWKMVSESNSS